MDARQPALAPRTAPQARVRWWAVALPVAVFLALFALLASPARADAGDRHGPYPGLSRVLPDALLDALHG